MTKSPGLFAERRKETEGAWKEESGVREQLREVEHEYVGLVREDEGRRERRGARERERRGGERRRRERSAAAVVLLLSFNPAAFLCSFQPACPPPV